MNLQKNSCTFRKVHKRPPLIRGCLGSYDRSYKNENWKQLDFDLKVRKVTSLFKEQKTGESL